MQQHGLQPDELQHRKEHADEGALGVGVVQQAAERDGLVLHDQAPLYVVDHLRDGDGLLIDIEHGASAQAAEHLAEDADEVDRVGGDLAVFVERRRLAHRRRGGSCAGREWSRWPLRSAASASASGRRP